MARLKKRFPLLVFAGTLIVAIFAIVAMVLLAPGLVGRFAEQALSEHVELARRETQGITKGITIRSEHHERRWFRSQSRQRVEIIDPELEAKFRELLNLDADAQTPDLLIDTRIDHGPIPFTSLAHEHGSLMPGLARSVSSLSLDRGDADSMPLSARMTGALDFGGTFAAVLRVEAGSTAVEGPIDGNIDGNAASWSTIDLRFDVGASGGGFELSIDSLEAENADGRYALGPIEIAGSAEASGGRVDMRFRASLHIDEAPGVDASRIDVEAGLDGVDGARLARLREVVEAMASEADDAAAMAAMEREILAVLAAGLEFRLDRLDIEVPRGRTETRLSLTMASSDAVDYDWSSALAAMACDAELSVAEAAVEAAMQTNDSIVAAVGTGFLKKDGEVYRMRVKCSNGLMTVNGAPLPLHGVIP